RLQAEVADPGGEEEAVHGVALGPRPLPSPVGGQGDPLTEDRGRDRFSIGGELAADAVGEGGKDGAAGREGGGPREPLGGGGRGGAGGGGGGVGGPCRLKVRRGGRSPPGRGGARGSGGSSSPAPGGSGRSGRRAGSDRGASRVRG